MKKLEVLHCQEYKSLLISLWYCVLVEAKNVSGQTQEKITNPPLTAALILLSHKRKSQTKTKH